MRRVATKIVLTFAVALAAFGLVAALAIVRLQSLGQDLKLLSAGYFPLGRIAAQLEVKDWVSARVLEATDLDPAARRAYLPVARAHFPALVREKIEEGKQVAREAARLGSDEDAKVLATVAVRLDALARHWAEYDAAAGALLDLAERGTPARPALEARLQEVRQLERGLSVEVKLLEAQLEARISDRVRAAERAESRTVVLIVLYALVAFLVGLASALFARRLLSPIERLTQGVKAVAAGDLSRQVEVSGHDEIGVLAGEFNAMAASLASQQRELRRAERLAAVGRISAQITHEVRNPLNAIGLNAELLAEELEGRAVSAEARALCAAISREVDRLNAVTEEYLRFARPPRQAPVRQDLAELGGALLDFLAPELAAARVEVRRELQPGLPAVRGDEGQLRAVLLNLVRNAREAMAGGGTLTVAARAAGGGVELEVRDSGGGIRPEDLGRVFDPFFSTKERGTGLGLAFVQQVVQEHGGTVRCESTPGEGTRFTLHFPAAPEERSGEPLAAQAVGA
jgi:signal transduction histidine kinase